MEGQHASGGPANVGTTGGAPNPAQSAATDNGDDARRVAHELLGQTQGLMFIAMREDEIRLWCPPELLDAVRASGPGLWLAFAEAHAAVASGQHDDRLREVGMSQVLAEPKRRGLAGALQRLYTRFTETADRLPGELRRHLQNAIAWARGPIGSMSFIPGVEVIGEALDVTQAALSQTELVESTNSPTEAASESGEAKDA
jgi:hypothetical protein